MNVGRSVDICIENFLVQPINFRVTDWDKQPQPQSSSPNEGWLDGHGFAQPNASLCERELHKTDRWVHEQ